MDPYRPGHYAPYRAPSYERPPYTPPPSYGQTSRGGYTSGGASQRSSYMPRQGYGPAHIPVGITIPMVTTGSEVEKLTTLFIGGISPGVTDDWMEKILKGWKL